MRMTVSDEDLALAAANGDGQAFTSLINRQYDRLYRLCFRLTGSQHEAEDLTQDICAALPAKLASYKRQSKVTTWLYRVAVNASHDRRRKQATHGKAADGWGDWELNRQAVIEENQTRADWLTEAMGQLAPDLRDTLALVLDDMTHAEAGEILGVSEGTIRNRVSALKDANMLRIVAIADVFDALTSERPYKPAWPLSRAIALLREGRGSHFDPAVVDAFLARRDEFADIAARLADPEPAGGEAA